ncbi:hypothetical protein [uncultured Kordia sp.]|uniref:hypothetical protein n=1 Tax=uncultured Kordia sp. TaxID=507699 RepID=UPI002634EA6B|nr:hypothetical protein [uncultured Kordia sp.]
MKTTITYAVLLIITFIYLVSCNHTQAETNSFKPIVVDWDLSCPHEHEPHKIGSTEATKGLTEYKDYIDRVKETLDKKAPEAFPDKEDKLNYGSEVDFDLLLEVLAHRKFVCSDKLFLMNTIRPKLDENRKPIEGEPVTEIMFVLESKDHKENPTYTYFDFTRPCPNGCPKNIPNLEYPTNN